MIKHSIQYIEKPFKIQDLADAIFSALDRKETFGGQLKGISQLSFLTLIEREHLSCVCEVSSLTGGKGYYIFNRGVLYNAKYGEVVGEEAAEALLGMREPTIKFKCLPQKAIPRVIRCKISQFDLMRKGKANGYGIDR